MTLVEPNDVPPAYNSVYHFNLSDGTYAQQFSITDNPVFDPISQLSWGSKRFAWRVGLSKFNSSHGVVLQSEHYDLQYFCLFTNQLDPNLWGGQSCYPIGTGQIDMGHNTAFTMYIDTYRIWQRSFVLHTPIGSVYDHIVLYLGNDQNCGDSSKLGGNYTGYCPSIVELRSSLPSWSKTPHPAPPNGSWIPLSDWSPNEHTQWSLSDPSYYPKSNFTWRFRPIRLTAAGGYGAKPGSLWCSTPDYSPPGPFGFPASLGSNRIRIRAPVAGVQSKANPSIVYFLSLGSYFLSVGSVPGVIRTSKAPEVIAMACFNQQRLVARGNSTHCGCGDNQILNVVDNSCSNCQNGYYLQSGVCTISPAGYFANSYGIIFACPPGSYSSAGSYQSPKLNEFQGCNLCPPGTGTRLSGSSLSDCVSSLPGEYLQPVTTLSPYSPILPCPVGTYSAFAGAVICATCPMGLYQNLTGRTYCSTPISGHFASSNFSMHPCSPGSCSIGGQITTCSSCLVGFYQPLFGQTSCLETWPGSFANNSGFILPSLCAAGSFSNVSSSSTCLHCSIGTYQPSTGQTSCRIPPEGYIVVEQDPSLPAVPCPTGTFAASPISCLHCPDKQYQDKVAQTSCVPTPIGYSFVSSMEAPVPCPTGTFGFNFSCHLCLPPTYNNISASANCSLLPQPGYIIPSAGLTAPLQCNAPSYAPTSGLTSCLVPFKPYYRVSPSSVELASAGYYVDSDESSDQIPCQIGRFTPRAGFTACSFCDVYTTSNLSSSTCVDCEPGQFAPSAGYCVDAAVGSYSASGKSNLALFCSPGSVTNAPRQSTCQLCAAGSFQSQAGQSICNGCGINQYSDIGATTCSTCGENFYIDKIGSCSPCPQGTFRPSASLSTSCNLCSNGTTTTAAKPGSACAPCPVGTASVLGRSCVSCEPGSFGLLIGQTSCSRCPEFTSQPDAGQSNCRICPFGSFINSTSNCTVIKEEEVLSIGLLLAGTNGTGISNATREAWVQRKIGQTMTTPPAELLIQNSYSNSYALIILGASVSCLLLGFLLHFCLSPPSVPPTPHNKLLHRRPLLLEEEEDGKKEEQVEFQWWWNLDIFSRGDHFAGEGRTLRDRSSAIGVRYSLITGFIVITLFAYIFASRNAQPAIFESTLSAVKFPPQLHAVPISIHLRSWNQPSCEVVEATTSMSAIGSSSPFSAPSSMSPLCDRYDTRIKKNEMDGCSMTLTCYSSFDFYTYVSPITSLTIRWPNSTYMAGVDWSIDLPPMTPEHSNDPVSIAPNFKGNLSGSSNGLMVGESGVMIGMVPLFFFQSKAPNNRKVGFTPSIISVMDGKQSFYPSTTGIDWTLKMQWSTTLSTQIMESNLDNWTILASCFAFLSPVFVVVGFLMRLNERFHTSCLSLRNSLLSCLAAICCCWCRRCCCCCRKPKPSPSASTSFTEIT